MATSRPLFQTYTQMPQRLPPWAWRIIRWGSVIVAFSLVATALLRPSLGLRLFWDAYVPVLPLLFMVAPGLWRNICPMAALNQIPRTLGFSRGLTLPPRAQQFTPLISASLFLLLVGLRHVLLDGSGVGLAVFLLMALALAFAGGVVFKGKSGWCSQFCPMLQVERFYGQSPLRVLPNSHCRPCVGCTVNCYDFNPTAAYLADLHDHNPRLSANRRLFAGAMPWLIVAFFTQPDLQVITMGGVLELYGHILLLALAGIGVFMFLEAVVRPTSQQLALIHVLVAFNLFYGFVTPLALAPLGAEARPISYVLQAAAAILSAVWFVRALPREQAYLSVGNQAPPRVGEAVLRLHNAGRSARAEVIFSPGPTAEAKIDEPLLDIAEAHGVPIEAGCRMGVCGADPLRILAGADNLSVMTPSEQATLERLGLTTACRLACMARVNGPVTVTTSTATFAPLEETPAGTTSGPSAGPSIGVDTTVQQVVIVGTGAAGIAAALEARRLNPAATVTVVGDESYDYYNRMAIGKLVSESTSIEKLYLMPRDWAAAKGVNVVRGVSVTAVEPTLRRVITESGEALPYDRLLLATGARAARPPIENGDLGGVFALRTIDDAVEIQQHIRRRRCRAALVVGGGLLGLEIAYSISHLGVRVVVVDRNEWPLSRQLDRPAGTLLWQMMNDLGVPILSGVQAHRLLGSTWIEGAELSDGQTVEASLCVVAAGNAPNVSVARAAGLTVARGLIVDQHMRTSDPHIYAAGDVAECAGHLGGLWPASVEQARIAAINMLGGDQRYTPAAPPTRLKVAAIDLLSVGEITPRGAQGSELCLDDSANRQYRKLVLDGTRVRGGILIGHADLADAVSKAADAQLDVKSLLPTLRAGDWSVLPR